MKTNEIRLNNLKQKVKSQKNIQSFYDNLVAQEIVNHWNDEELYGENTSYVLEEADFVDFSKNNRFCSYKDRVQRTKNKQIMHPNILSLSQGTHSILSWNNLQICKTAFDFCIYTMLIQEIKPDVIVEFGSGSGGSAVWLTDIAIQNNKNFKKTYSYDKNKVNINYNNISFIQCNLKNNNKFNWESGKKIIIEDLHTNITNNLLKTDKILNIGDYVIIEDSKPKHKEISNFLKQAKNNYLVDQFYLDFFGMNNSCCVDSIFKVV